MLRAIDCIVLSLFHGDWGYAWKKLVIVMKVAFCRGESNSGYRIEDWCSLHFNLYSNGCTYATSVVPGKAIIGQMLICRLIMRLINANFSFRPRLLQKSRCSFCGMSIDRKQLIEVRTKLHHINAKLLFTRYAKQSFYNLPIPMHVRCFILDHINLLCVSRTSFGEFAYSLGNPR